MQIESEENQIKGNRKHCEKRYIKKVFKLQREIFVKNPEIVHNLRKRKTTTKSALKKERKNNNNDPN